jgi:hypothetical protein
MVVFCLEESLMRKPLLAVVLSNAVAALVTVTPVLAHHSFTAEYDANKPVTIKGAITRMAWINPHAWLYVDRKESDGKVVNYAIEFVGPQTLYRRGLRPADLPVGVEVTVEGWLAKDGTPHINAARITMPNGSKLFTGGSNGAPDLKDGAPKEKE